MADIIATGSKTIVDLSDGKSLSVYLTSNQARTQILDVNKTVGAYNPDWTTPDGKLIIAPVIYANQTPIEIDASAVSVTYKRKEGSGAETQIPTGGVTGETVANKILTISENKMSPAGANLITYLAYVTYTDPDTLLPINAVAEITFALVTTGQNAKTVSIIGEQIFKYTGATPSPAQITLNAVTQNVTPSQWQIKTGTSTWANYPVTGDNVNTTSSTLNIKPAHPIWVYNASAATIRMVTNDANVSDITTIYKVSDGASGDQGPAGVSSKIAYIANENVSFLADKDGKAAAVTVTARVIAYDGGTKVTPTLGTISGAIASNLSVTAKAAINNEIPIELVVTANALLGGAAQQSGTISVGITSPVVTTLYISWTKINAGATGQNAVVFSVYTLNGNLFTNTKSTADKMTLLTSRWDGSTEITTGATYQWFKYSGGGWGTAIAGQTGNSLEISAADVVGSQSYQAKMTYKTKVYTDTITILDKTDNYQAEIESTAGDIFKNTIGSTALICRLWQTGAEVDAVKSKVFSITQPGSGVAGDYYYKLNPATRETTLWRYATSWTDVTTNASYKHTRIYKWYRRDYKGDPLDGGAVFATGKVIYINGDHVDNKTVFICEVE